MKYKWGIEYSGKTEEGESVWTLGYLKNNRYRTIGQVYNKDWAKKIIASLELHDAAMDLPNYPRLPPLREIGQNHTTKKKEKEEYV